MQRISCPCSVSLADIRMGESLRESFSWDVGRQGPIDTHFGSVPHYNYPYGS
jgi:hypothetical protein